MHHIIPNQTGDIAADGRSTISVINPSTEEELAVVACATREDLDDAVSRSRQAFKTWRKSSQDERRALLVRMGEMLEDNLEDLGRLLAMEVGRPLAAAKAEVATTGAWMKKFANIEVPVTVIEENDQRRVERRHVPLGVVAAIPPWNFPVRLAMGKVAHALLTGNTVILKPSPMTPLTALRIAELTKDIAPEGVFQTIVGGDELGPWLTAHPDIDKISFTGSTATGKKVMASASDGLKRVTLELGGNDPSIILEDADVERLVPEVFWAAFRNSGQLCFATKRLYVHDAIYDKFLEGLVAFARNVKIGDSLDETSELGPIQNKAQFERVKSLLSNAKKDGLTFALGGDVKPTNEPGYFVPIAIIDNPPDDSEIVQVEPFGPVLPVMKFSAIEDVIRRANDTPYGLSATVYSSDVQKAEEVAMELEAGMIWVNTPQYMGPEVPFGGAKQSGMGVENGPEGLLEFTSGRTVVVGK